MMGLAGLVGRWVGRAWPPTIRPSSKAPPPGCSHLLGGPMEGNKLLLLGQGHSADGGERPGAGGGVAGVRVVVRLCLGGRSRWRDLTASAELLMASGNTTINQRPRNNNPDPLDVSALSRGNAHGILAN